MSEKLRAVCQLHEDQAPIQLGVDPVKIGSSRAWMYWMHTRTAKKNGRKTKNPN